MEEFANNCGYSVTETISEIGGGLNFKRKKFMEMIVSMLKGEIEVIVVAHKDRLCRFAFDFVDQLGKYSNCRIVVANQTYLSPQQELCDDLLAIVHCFSCRLYGLRSYSKNLKKNLKSTINNLGEIKLECNPDEIQC